MEVIITFFRDILDGPFYIVLAIICGILICSCIGYLAEKSINKKKEKARYAKIDNPNVPTPAVAQAPAPNPVAQPQATSQPIVTQPAPPQPENNVQP